MRKIFYVAVLVLGLVAAPSAAHATSVTYDLTLTNVTGNVAGGIGSLTVDATPGAWSPFYQNGGAGSLLSALSFTIGGDTFSLAESVGTANAVFLNGDLFNITYLGSLANNNKVTISLATNGLQYVFYDQLTNLNSIGVINAKLAAAQTSATAPEPSALILFGTGAIGLAGLGFRKFAA